MGSRAFVLVSTSQSKEGDTLSLQWNESSLPAILFQPLRPAAIVPGVSLKFRAEDQRGLISAQLHEAAGRDGLDRVRARFWHLSEIVFPKGVAGIFSWRDRGGAEWADLDIGAEPIAAAMQRAAEPIVSAINGRLRDCSLDVHLNFGPFGRYAAYASVPMTVTRAKLPAEIRNRIIWFCKRSQKYLAANGRTLEYLEDRELIDVFHHCKSAPELTSHKRALERAVAREGLS
jgi:hypothetical protein